MKPSRITRSPLGATLAAFGAGLLLSQVVAEAYLPRPYFPAVGLGAVLLVAGALVWERA